MIGVVYKNDERSVEKCFRYSNDIVVKLDSKNKSAIKQFFFCSINEPVTIKAESLKLIKSSTFFNPVIDSAKTGSFNNDISAIDFAKKMRVGWNLGNSLDCYTGLHDLSSQLDWGEPYITKEIVELGKNNGYTTIRIPITWCNHK